MAEHRVEIQDRKGTSVQLMVTLPLVGQGRWYTLDKGGFRYEQGVVDVGRYPTALHSWLALYGGSVADDAKLVVHFDDFLRHTGVNAEGQGTMYLQDNIRIDPGPIAWKTVY